MENQLLPFQIGEQYEKWEFELEILDIERIPGYDSYIYIREISVFGAIPRYVELIFCLDVLEAVIMTFDFYKKEQKLNFQKSLKPLKLKSITSRYNISKNTLIFSYGTLNIIPKLTLL